MDEKIKRACEFFLRYKDNPELLIKEHPEYKEAVEKIRKKYLTITNILLKLKHPDVKIENDTVTFFVDGIKEKINLSHAFLTDYSNWLFEEAFKEVMGWS